MEQIVAAVVAGVFAVVVAVIGRTVRKVERNTRPNGHGTAPEAIGKVIDDVGLLSEQMGNVVRWQAKHQARHEFEDARIAARLDVDARLLRRVADFLDTQGATE